jgi:hypothetical protein
MATEKSKRRAAAVNEELAPVPAPSIASRLTPFLERHSVLLAIVLIAIASARIVSTYRVFSHTADEPAHIACGLEWLDRGTYAMEAQHPPLARVFTGIGPFLLGRRLHGPAADPSVPTGTEEDFGPRFRLMALAGMDILYQNQAYDATLAAARAGILPFFWLACAVVYLWAKRDFGAPVALAALLLFSSLPPVLAHASLATTDMALTATLGAAFLAGRIWLERPTPRTAAVFGFCAGLAVAAKFSSLVYFPAAAIVAILWYLATTHFPSSRFGPAIRERVPTFGIAVAALAAVVWAAYRFSFGKVYFGNVRLPAPEFYLGLLEVTQHNARGHLTYLLGQLSPDGFWYYYPVVLLVKTPLGLLVLALAGAAIAVRRRRQSFAAGLPLAFTAGILVAAWFGRINIGVRHILPVYLGLSILAAQALWRALDDSSGRKWLPPAAAALALWAILASGASHPDYLPYFNEIAAAHPENVLVDSDLDWGQDFKRLKKRLADAGAKSVAFTPIAYLDPQKERDLPPLAPNDPKAPYAGWNAVSLTQWKEDRFGLGVQQPELTFWPDTVPPQQVVGKSIFLWYFPPAGNAPTR